MPSGTTIIDRLSMHNHWATKRLLTACRSVSREQFTHRFEIGVGSLHDTVLHIISAMHRWADRIAERPLRDAIRDRDADRVWTVDELIVLLDETAGDLHEVVSRVREEKRINEVMEVHFQSSGETYRFTRGTAIVHIFTHGTHHRAQCLNMLRRLGAADIPDLDAVDAELAEQA